MSYDVTPILLEDGMNTIWFGFKIVSCELIGPDIPGAQQSRQTVIEYDSILGPRKTIGITLLADAYDYIKVGGTMSAGPPPEIGRILEICGETIIVSTPSAERIECVTPLGEKFEYCQSVYVFDYMCHDRGHYGEFLKAVTAYGNIMFNLHSINLILMKGDDECGVIKIDPFSGMINSDALEVSRI